MDGEHIAFLVVGLVGGVGGSLLSIVGLVGWALFMLFFAVAFAVTILGFTEGEKLEKGQSANEKDGNFYKEAEWRKTEPQRRK